MRVLTIALAMIAGLAMPGYAQPAQRSAPATATELIADFERKLERSESLASELGAMAARDQLIRHFIIQGFQAEMTTETRQAYIDGTRPIFARIDGANTARLREILRTMSWEQIEALGSRAAGDAWSIVSHSPDLAFKREMLTRFEPMALAGRIAGDRYAMLFDDVALEEGRLQRYGTNFDCQGGEYRPKPTEDPARLNERRAALRMEPIETYAATMRRMYGRCPTR
jgi:hypothetical protein